MLYGSPKRRTSPRRTVALLGATKRNLELLNTLGGGVEASIIPSKAGLTGAFWSRPLDLLVVDTDQFVESEIRPWLLETLAGRQCVLGFVCSADRGWFDDLGAARSGYVPEVSADALLRLIGAPTLTVVAS